LLVQPILREKLEIRIMGRITENERKYFNVPEIRELITVLDYQPHSQIIQEIVDADILLLTFSDLPGAERVIPGKVFEYMASGNRILAIIPDGAAKDILVKNYKNINVFSPNETIKIAQFLSSINEKTTFDVHEREIDSIVSKFSRFHLAGKLATFADSLLAPKNIVILPIIAKARHL
jgi:hypothetical protein